MIRFVNLYHLIFVAQACTNQKALLVQHCCNTNILYSKDLTSVYQGAHMDSWPNLNAHKSYHKIYDYLTKLKLDLSFGDRLFMWDCFTWSYDISGSLRCPCNRLCDEQVLSCLVLWVCLNLESSRVSSGCGSF